VPFAAALSEHPLTAIATGEVCGAILERLGGHPDLVIVFVTLAHGGALEDVMDTVEAVLHPAVALGAASDSIVGTGREVEGSAAISMWAGRWGPVLPVRITTSGGGGGDGAAGDVTFAGIPRALPFEPRALVLLGDPYSIPGQELLDEVAAVHPGIPVVGGLASGARGPGGTRLALDGAIYTAGAVGVLIGPGADVVALVSQGGRPIGRPYVVTEATANIVRELGGKPALARLDEMAGTLTPTEVKAINDGGLHLGRVVDERKPDFGPGDFLLRQILGGDRETGAIAVNEVLEVGTTVQFHVRDAAGAHDDLDSLLGRHMAEAVAPGDVAEDGEHGEPEAALLFTCNGRGMRFFGVPNHDAELLSERLGPIPTAGFFAAGELGPLAGHNELHSFTASVLLLRDHRFGGFPGNDVGVG